MCIPPTWKAAISLKKNLPAVLSSGRVKERSYEGIQQRSSILECPISELRGKLKEDPHVIFVFLSSTGSGLKVNFKLPADSEGHAASFSGIAAHVKQEYGKGIDPACKNLSRLCFTSNDADIYINWEAEELEVQDFDASDQSHWDDSKTVFDKTVEQFGKPFYPIAYGEISRINQRFWQVFT